MFQCETSVPRAGGTLRIEARAPGGVILRSARLGCEGCRRRVRAVLEGSRGVVAVDDAGPDELAVGYDPARLRVTGIADKARRALESDPWNPAPVAVTYVTPTYSTPRRGVAPVRREPASTPIVETHAGMR